MGQPKAPARKPGRFHVDVNWKVLVPLAMATALFASAAFLAWQTWLVAGARAAEANAESLQRESAAALGRDVAAARHSIATALAAAPVQQALESGTPDRLAVAGAAVRNALPPGSQVDLYEPDLGPILHGDVAKFGYARAAMLALAQSEGPAAPARLQGSGTHGLVLALAQPVMVGGQLSAYALAAVPFDAPIAAFRGRRVPGARVELRQGEVQDGSIVAFAGNARPGEPLGFGTVVPGSKLRVVTAIPEAFVVVSRNPVWPGLLAALCLLGGIVALYVRRMGMRRAVSVLRRPTRKPVPVEPTMAETLRQQAAEAKAAPSAATTTAAAVAAEGAKGDAKAPKPAVGGGAKPNIQVDRGIFRTYDIRGVVGEGLTPDVARLIGRAVGSEVRARDLTSIVIGRDGRPSGPDLQDAATEGLRQSGLDVIDLGAVPTPIVYFACRHLDTRAGMAVTGSHNPPGYNGFKIVVAGEALSGDAIQALYTRITEGRFESGPGYTHAQDMRGDYAHTVTEDVQIERPLKVVVDCGNGIAGETVPGILEGIGAEVVPLYCEVDGNFPNHHPDPSDPANLRDLILSVQKVDADLGLAFDGDGDRLGVVTAAGEIIHPDRVLMLFAIDVLARNPGATVIYDVKCSGHLQPLILQHGGSPVMACTGHSLIKAKMAETGAILAGEMSGHFFFADRWYGFDDATYAAARLLEILASDPEGRSPVDIFASLPQSVATPELRIPMQEGESRRIVEAFREAGSFDGARLTLIDGVRADWPDGFGLMRASNTTPMLILRFEADNEAALRRIQDVFRAGLLKLDPSLPLPF